MIYVPNETCTSLPSREKDETQIIGIIPLANKPIHLSIPSFHGVEMKILESWVLEKRTLVSPFPFYLPFALQAKLNFYISDILCIFT